MRHFVVLKEGDKVAEFQEVNSAPGAIIFLPQFSAKYCDANDVWQIPVNKFRLMRVRKSASKTLYYYDKVQDESSPGV